MNLVIYLAVLGISFLALIKGADVFVDGACGVARLLRVPSLIIGLTVVSMGTSLPETAVSVTASLADSNEIAISNVLGSNIFNLLVVLGVCALIRPVPVDRNVVKRDFPFTILPAIGLFALLCLPNLKSLLYAGSMDANVAQAGRITGIVLLVVFGIYIFILAVEGKRCAACACPDEDDNAPKSSGGALKYAVFIIIGCVLIIAGGKGAVWSAKLIAAMCGMSETLIGLTVVAIGTSLPELITSMVASRKGEAALAVGNAVGSSIFNLLFVLGASCAISPVTINLASVYDLAIFIFVSAVTMYFCYSRDKISKFEGICLVFLYAADMVFAIAR